MLSRGASLLTLCTVAGCAASPAEPRCPEHVAANTPAIGSAPETVAWTRAPPNLPPGAEVAVLEGDPRLAGLFTLRIKLPRDYRLPPHTHAQHERVTVLSGSVHVGFGTSPNAATRRYTSGSYYVNPAAVPHFLWVEEPAVLQITTTGPWTVEPATPPP